LEYKLRADILMSVPAFIDLSEADQVSIM